MPCPHQGHTSAAVFVTPGDRGGAAACRHGCQRHCQAAAPAAAWAGQYLPASIRCSTAACHHLKAAVSSMAMPIWHVDSLWSSPGTPLMMSYHITSRVSVRVRESQHPAVQRDASKRWPPGGGPHCTAVQAGAAVFGSQAAEQGAQDAATCTGKPHTRMWCQTQATRCLWRGLQELRMLWNHCSYTGMEPEC